MNEFKYDFRDVDSESSHQLAGVASALSCSYADRIGVNLLDGSNLPRRSEVIASTEKLLEVIFPGFDGMRQRRSETVASDIEELLKEIYSELFDQICRAIQCSCDIGSDRECRGCGGQKKANASLLKLLKDLPEIREITKLDVAAAYAGDPAATCYDEIILSYPAIKTITVQRLAHVLYMENIPLIPRMMTEYVHSLTGIDIHPGATLGKGVFIDHGTGVVVGETAIIGDNVRIYQGVTLGAVSFPKDACGLLIKGNKRHPTIGNNVIIYSGASVLGDITIGDNSVIGGNVWLTESLPPGTKITASPPENNLRFTTPKQS